jgi:hypothetical protein
MESIEATKDNLLLVVHIGESVGLYVVDGYDQAMQTAEYCIEKLGLTSDNIDLYTLPDMQQWHPDDDDRHTIHSFLD